MTYMRLKFKLPDLIIERISQYLGNCRLHNGELIQTIDKSSKEIVELQWKLESRIRHTYLTTYTSSEWEEISKKKEDGKRSITYALPNLGNDNPDIFFDNHNSLPNLDNHVPVSSLNDHKEAQNWKLKALWPQDKFGNKYRLFCYAYEADTDTLTFKYIRKKHQTVKDGDPLNKNINVELIIK